VAPVTHIHPSTAGTPSPLVVGSRSIECISAPEMIWAQGNKLGAIPKLSFRLTSLEGHMRR